MIKWPTCYTTVHGILLQHNDCDMSSAGHGTGAHLPRFMGCTDSCTETATTGASSATATITAKGVEAGAGERLLRCKEDVAVSELTCESCCTPGSESVHSSPPVLCWPIWHKVACCKQAGTDGVLLPPALSWPHAALASPESYPPLLPALSCPNPPLPLLPAIHQLAACSTVHLGFTKAGSTHCLGFS